jgi:uncharacterized protein YlxW (UPF0749 family)
VAKDITVTTVFISSTGDGEMRNQQVDLVDGLRGIAAHVESLQNQIEDLAQETLRLRQRTMSTQMFGLDDQKANDASLVLIQSRIKSLTGEYAIAMQSLRNAVAGNENHLTHMAHAPELVTMTRVM